MPRPRVRPPLYCASCGKSMSNQAGSLPQGEAMCHPCRNLREAMCPRRPRRTKRNLRTPSRRRTCEVCGAGYKASYAGQRACGRACGVILRGHTPGRAPKVSPSYSKNCQVCEAQFETKWNVQQVCGEACQRKRNATLIRSWATRHPDRIRDAASRRRATKQGAPAERIDLLAVADRDRWRCQICRRKVNPSLQWPHPMSRSLDHVVPLSRGGEHTAANAQLAHLTCNVRKGNRGGGEQLALLG